MNHLGFEKSYSCTVRKRLCNAIIFFLKKFHLLFIISFHAITGADSICSFYGHSKKTEDKKKTKKSSEAQKLVSNLGKHDRLSEDDIMKCSKYLVKYIYRDKESTTIVEARARKLRLMKNKITLRLPPDGNSFVQHLPWANYQARIWCNFTTPDGPANPFHYG